MYKQQSGFTLIELVVVIVILGILAATALPRFISISTDARVAKMQGVAAAMASAGSLAHAAQLVANAVSNASISMEGATIAMNNGYPKGTTTDIAVAANISNDYVFSAAAGVLTVYPDTGHQTANTCKVTYTEAVAPSPPVIDKTNLSPSSNCS